ncbi:hypothetical protein Brms1b_013251 [Colletotrichum noveboracense]|nr:hypothetical protein Brms1b_013251 [Colletotrichum noveboracense]
MAPIGILTALVSAIRVCGSPSLKAFIGRAKEAAGNVEAELLSSTSRNVCELYNGGGIERIIGRPKILEVVLDRNVADEEFTREGGSAGIYTFADYVRNENHHQEWRPWPHREGTEPSQGDGPKTTEEFGPNLSHNVSIKRLDDGWFRVEILGTFVKSILDLVKSIGEVEVDGTADNVCLRSRLASELAEAIEKSGLASRDDALLCVLPPIVRREFDAQRTPLWFAAGIGAEGMVSEALGQITDRHGSNLPFLAGPLLQAASKGRDNIVRLLLQHGADPNVADASRTTPLCQASENSHEQVVRVLLEFGEWLTRHRMKGPAKLYKDAFEISLERYLHCEDIEDRTEVDDKEAIKVAVLGQGIDSAKLRASGTDLDQHIFGTRNFASETHSEKGLHWGSTLASLIHQYGPKAKIYVAKVTDDPRVHSQDAEWIVEAIAYAIESWDVDIIVLPFGFRSVNRIAAGIVASFLEFVRISLVQDEPKLNLSPEDHTWLRSTDGMREMLHLMSTPIDEYNFLTPWAVFGKNAKNSKRERIFDVIKMTVDKRRGRVVRMPEAGAENSRTSSCD